jgi:hypothetical protein
MVMWAAQGHLVIVGIVVSVEVVMVWGSVLWLVVVMRALQVTWKPVLALVVGLVTRATLLKAPQRSQHLVCETDSHVSCTLSMLVVSIRRVG